ncbi:MAG: hypothetical protein ACR2NZ_08760 [Rubripirellula sp.]
MNVHFSPRLQRLLIALSIALPVLSAAQNTYAERYDCGSDIVPIYESASPCGFELAGTEELCGWGPLGTHDSAPTPTLAPPKHIAKPDNSSPSVPTVKESIAMLAATACRSAGVSVEQIVEPFVMVGPYLNDSLDSVQAFQTWWDGARDGIYPQPDPLQAQLDAIAAQEPIDVESFGVSILTFEAISEDAPSVLRKVTGIEVKAIDRLVGSSAIIATVEEDYMPYDLSARDLPLWSVFPVSTQPFCVRNQIDEFDSAVMWKDFDHVVSNDEAELSSSDEVVNATTDPSGDANQESNITLDTAEDELTKLHVNPEPVQDVTDLVSENTPGIEAISEGKTLAYCGSADCLLDDVIWQVESLAAQSSPVRTALAPRSIGRTIASLFSGSTQLFEAAAHRIATRWPETESNPRRSPSGDRLLARAGAIESSVAPEDALDSEILPAIGPPMPADFPSSQLAELPTDSKLR